MTHSEEGNRRNITPFILMARPPGRAASVVSLKLMALIMPTEDAPLQRRVRNTWVLWSWSPPHPPVNSPVGGMCLWAAPSQSGQPPAPRCERLPPRLFPQPHCEQHLLQECQTQNECINKWQRVWSACVYRDIQKPTQGHGTWQRGWIGASKQVKSFTGGYMKLCLIWKSLLYAFIPFPFCHSYLQITITPCHM